MALFLDESVWNESLDVGPAQPEWGRLGSCFQDAGCWRTRQDSVMETSGGVGPPLFSHVYLSMCILSQPWGGEQGARTQGSAHWKGQLEGRDTGTLSQLTPPGCQLAQSPCGPRDDPHRVRYSQGKPWVIPV